VSKLIRRILTGTIVLAGMGAIVFGQGLEAKAFLLEEDFSYEIVTDESGQQFFANSMFDRGWTIENASYPALPGSPPTSPQENDPDYATKIKEYNRKRQEYDFYQSYGAKFGWTLNGGPGDGISTDNTYLATGFLAGALFEPDVTISTWAISPVVALENGAELSFNTRQQAYRFSDKPDAVYPNRLEVRYNTTGSCSSASFECSSADGGIRELYEALNLGDFTYQFLNDDGTPLVINPDLEINGYPNKWMRVTGRISGLTQPASGRIGFHYFVPEASLSQNNASYIGIDNIRYQTPVPTPALLPGLLAIAWKNRRKRKHQAIA
jgi:hypothetical protein